ncbi:lipid A deacylase LpxR family protein [Poseidonibacter lekithochrous]|uniref:lipid A deacylase LpxR family protein n=1 Tax=Poseidonibacter TaxID=2321187 RepID=UPI001C0A4BE3|nr:MULTISPECIES: lipid A deacylase LpxR family protein [Poseidonibacter]MBU3013813.1 lipid A deacylase LpxR family protein [Poseidonibacter lekithochrous]MDO6827109.1 lipid A deacylase LpxR family protein [Poseidonibacter sp. 1_MG-2023]
MNLFIKTSLLTILSTIFFTISAQAQSLSLYLENDVIDGKDRHYTNGTSIVYVSDSYEDDFINKIPTPFSQTTNANFGIGFSQLTFTPSDIKQNNKIVGDLPYAGILNFDFFIYKWSETFFHEYMLTLGMVGASTKVEQIQETFHNITGNTKPQGWDNQLKDDFLYNFSYSFGHKSYKKTFDYGKLDINNSFRIDLGNYNRAASLSSMIRYGSGYTDNFNTAGRLIGSNENKQLNIHKRNSKDINWSISYGLTYTYTDFFYVNDHDKSYNLEKIRETITQIVSLDTYFDEYIISFNFKSNKSLFDNNVKSNWAGISLIYLF